MGAEKTGLFQGKEIQIIAKGSTVQLFIDGMDVSCDLSAIKFDFDANDGIVHLEIKSFVT